MPLPTLHLQTCFFGYPLKQGSYAFLGAEAVILIFGVLGTIFGGQISLGILITLIVMTCLVIATGMGLYGIKEEKTSYIVSYMGVQAFCLFILVLGILGSLTTLQLVNLLLLILLFAFMGYTLLVVYSYFQQLRQNTSSTGP